MSTQQVATKRCAKSKGGCGESFTAVRALQAACSPACALVMAETRREKAERRADKATREKLKPRSQWVREAQVAVNRWVRQRDAELGCVSCGTHDGKMNAGHYLSTGAQPGLRFEPTNIHKQCERCNSYLHGNLIPYRAELIRRVGLAEVERLEGPHAPSKFTVDDLKWIIQGYRAKARNIERQT